MNICPTLTFNSFYIFVLSKIIFNTKIDCLHENFKTLVTALFVVAFWWVQERKDYKSAIGAKWAMVWCFFWNILNKKAAVNIFGGIRWGGLAAGAYYEDPQPCQIGWKPQMVWVVELLSAQPGIMVT